MRSLPRLTTLAFLIVITLVASGCMRPENVLHSQGTEHTAPTQDAATLAAPRLPGATGEQEDDREAESDSMWSGQPWADLPSTQAPDVRITLDASRGPMGPDPARIDRRFYGLNVADWQVQDYHPEAKPEFIEPLKALQPGVLRWPAGHSSQEYIWERAPEALDARRVLRADVVESFLRLCEAVGAEPLLAVNLKTGTPEAAADFVRYVNVERGWDVTWWQVGNEPDHRDGLTESPEAYAERYLLFAEAMRAVDPDIRLVGAELMTGTHVVGTATKPDWLTPILEIAGPEMDAVGWHYYPLDSSQTSQRSSAYPTFENLFQESAPDWRPASLAFADEVFPHLDAKIRQHTPGAEVWVTEMAEDSAGGGIATIVGTHGAALWTADVMGRFAAHAPDAVVKFVFKSGASHRYTLLDESYAPRPAYSVYWLYANAWGDRVVSAHSSDITWVNGHAALRSDGKLALMLVNKGDADALVDVDIGAFVPHAASRYVLTGDGLEARASTLNGVTLDASNVSGANAPQAEPVELEEARAVHVPAYSVVLLVYDPAQ